MWHKESGQNKKLWCEMRVMERIEMNMVRALGKNEGGKVS